MWICFFPIFWHSTFADWFLFWKETRWIVANVASSNFSIVSCFYCNIFRIRWFYCEIFRRCNVFGHVFIQYCPIYHSDYSLYQIFVGCFNICSCSHYLSLIFYLPSVSYKYLFFYTLYEMSSPNLIYKNSLSSPILSLLLLYFFFSFLSFSFLSSFHTKLLD